MALVVLLRGVNVGGHRAFRPLAVANDLKRLGVVNIGAAGTFVIQQPVSRTELRAELARRLPFDTEIVICQGSDILRLMSREFGRARPGIVRFVSVLSRPSAVAPRLPLSFPSSGQWMLQVLARHDRFVVGQYRRHIKAISYFGTIDRLFGVPATTRNWNTMTAIATALGRTADGRGRVTAPLTR